MQADQMEQPLVLLLPTEEAQAAVQLLEIMAVDHTSTSPVHQAECCQVVLIGREWIIITFIQQLCEFEAKQAEWNKIHPPGPTVAS